MAPAELVPPSAAEAVALTAESAALADARAAVASLLQSGAFVLGSPTRPELRVLAKSLRAEHEGSSPCDLMDSFEGFRSMDALEAWCIQAWQRNEYLVLHTRSKQPAAGGGGGGASAAAAAAAAASTELLGRAHPLLVRGDPRSRYLLPAFLTIMVKNTRKPYIELLWVQAAVRRMGIGSLMVREVCVRQPGIRRVKAPLREAEPFWTAMCDMRLSETSWVLQKPCHVARAPA